MSLKVENRVDRFAKKIRIRNELLRQCLAECLGTFILTAFGIGAGAQYVLSSGKSGNVTTVFIGSAVGVGLALFCSLGVSGGHVNPAATIAFASVGRFPWYKVPAYIFSQFVGSFIASASIYVVYREALFEYEGVVRTIQTTSMFTSAPNIFLSINGGLIDQIFGTGMLLVCVMGIVDPKNTGLSLAGVPFALAMMVLGICCCFGLNCGNPINPARDLPPRMFLAIAGWGDLPFSWLDYQWWFVPVVGPIIGAVLGTWLYLLLVGFHYPDEDNIIAPEELPTTEVVTLSTFNHVETANNNKNSSRY